MSTEDSGLFVEKLRVQLPLKMHEFGMRWAHEGTVEHSETEAQSSTLSHTSAASGNGELAALKSHCP